jgi:exonuclease VII small subunit
MNQEDGDQPDATPVGDLSYAAAAGELDGIVQELDEGLVDVDVLEVRFRRAIEIVEELDRRIRGARKNVDALMPRLAAIGEDGGQDSGE